VNLHRISFPTLTHVECVCSECKVSVKFPLTSIEAPYITGEEKFICPKCKKALSDFSREAIKAAFDYQKAIGVMNTLSRDGIAYFLSE